ncbi:MAG: RNA helicase, partial [Methylobacterium sp.]
MHPGRPITRAAPCQRTGPNTASIACDARRPAGPAASDTSLTQFTDFGLAQPVLRAL